MFCCRQIRYCNLVSLLLLRYGSLFAEVSCESELLDFHLQLIPRSILCPDYQTPAAVSQQSGPVGSIRRHLHHQCLHLQRPPAAVSAPPPPVTAASAPVPPSLPTPELGPQPVALNITQGQSKGKFAHPRLRAGQSCTSQIKQFGVSRRMRFSYGFRGEVF